MQFLSMKCTFFSNSLTDCSLSLTWNYRFSIVFLGKNPSFLFEGIYGLTYWFYGVLGHPSDQNVQI